MQMISQLNTAILATLAIIYLCRVVVLGCSTALVNRWAFSMQGVGCPLVKVTAMSFVTKLNEWDTFQVQVM